ncbi:hypothetical protein ACFSHT_15810 [Paraburkholderia silviterrae]|uniref:Uncharacterized protein n=1 Tax=Paraburkholderia silviterrae TaxID=2528715 RepID=A0A4R5MA70_9BURK|nr:hypothetical protein [Paraburkholderia silviterrae]TDG23241.1 hypothetical protein EYW47_15025 [Paraburkholderia silviterrae]
MIPGAGLRSTLNGMQVIVNEQYDRVPRMHVSPSFAALMPQAFVDDLNAWMVEFFGTKREIYKIGDHTLVMGPETLARIKEQLR